MDRRTRICVWIIFLGLGNFLLYTVLYALLYGEAINGWVVSTDQGLRYYLQSGREVSAAAFVYSGIHSITIWPTVGAVMLAMLTLAKDRIASASRGRATGRGLITAIAVLITLAAVLMTIWFTHDFVTRLRHPAGREPKPAKVATCPID